MGLPLRVLSTTREPNLVIGDNRVRLSQALLVVEGAAIVRASNLGSGECDSL